MEPATPENEPRLYGSDVTGSWGQRVQILYETRPRDDLDRAFRIFAPGIDPAAPSLSWKGLAQGQIQRALGPTDIFFQWENGSIIFFMRCSTLAGSVKYPSCTQFFHYDGKIVQAQFDRRSIDGWKEVQDRIVGLLNRLREF
jgi:hypothetical protein